MKKDGGPAFPVQESVMSGGSPVPACSGMSLRDWFAGVAMQGIIANPTNRGSTRQVSFMAYATADAMLAEREKE